MEVVDILVVATSLQLEYTHEDFDARINIDNIRYIRIGKRSIICLSFELKIARMDFLCFFPV